MGFQNILVPTDGSYNTEAAILEAIDLAKTAEGHITALYTGDKNATNETANVAVSHVMELVSRSEMECSPMIKQGVPTDVIAETSSAYDVIVMGTLGRTGLKKVLVGSIAEKVVKSAACPVIVVGKRSELA